MSAPPESPITDLYSAHHGWLSNWLNKKLGCPHNAADIAQDAFVRLLLKHEVLQGLATPRAYLVRIAKGLLVDQWRRQELERHYLQALQHHEPHTSGSQELQHIIVETLLEIDAMLNRLNPKARQAFLLAQIDGLTYREIATQLEVSERMVKKYMAAAMMHCLLLRRELNEARA